MTDNATPRPRLLPALAMGLAVLLGTTGLVAPARAQEMTDVDTPRSDTLIVDMLNARVGNPTNMNMYQQGVTINQGFHQLASALLYDIDTANGEQIPDLAAAMPEALDDTYTRFRVKLREGLTWSDGQPFTADDVVFTAEMIRDTQDFAYSAAFTNNIASVTKVDDHTVEITTTRPTPRLSIVLGSVIYGNPFHVVPKHIWEQQDPATFANFPPVTISAYKFKDADPNGTWFLWEKRDGLAELRRRPDDRRAAARLRAVPLLRHRGAPGAGDGRRRHGHPDRHLAREPRHPAQAERQGPRLVHRVPLRQPRRSLRARHPLQHQHRALRRRADPLGAGAGDRPAAGEHRHLLGHAARVAARHPADVGADGDLPQADGGMAGRPHARGRLQALRPRLRRPHGRAAPLRGRRGHPRGSGGGARPARRRLVEA